MRSKFHPHHNAPNVSEPQGSRAVLITNCSGSSLSGPEYLINMSYYYVEGLGHAGQMSYPLYCKANAYPAVSLLVSIQGMAQWLCSLVFGEKKNGQGKRDNKIKKIQRTYALIILKTNKTRINKGLLPINTKQSSNKLMSPFQEFKTESPFCLVLLLAPHVKKYTFYFY